MLLLKKKKALLKASCHIWSWFCSASSFFSLWVLLLWYFVVHIPKTDSSRDFAIRCCGRLSWSNWDHSWARSRHLSEKPSKRWRAMWIEFGCLLEPPKLSCKTYTSHPTWDSRDHLDFSKARDRQHLWKNIFYFHMCLRRRDPHRSKSGALVSGALLKSMKRPGGGAWLV